MTWTDIAIAPLGPLYFGDGRPLTAGETDYGEGRFPPSPRTAQGIVRTALLRSVPDLFLGRGADRDRITDLVGPPDALPDDWQLVGPWLARWHTEDETGVEEIEPWLALPRYVVAGAREKTLGVVTAISLAEQTEETRAGMRWDVGEIEHAPLVDSRARAAPGYIGPDGLRALLGGKCPGADQIRTGLPDFVAQETRIGLRVEPEREVADEGMLYTLGYRRFADNSGLGIRFRGRLHQEVDPGALTRGTTSIGGKSRVARLLSVRSWSAAFAAALEPSHLPAEPEDEDRFWLWTTTSVPLEQPWAPQFAVPSLGDATLKIVTAVVGQAESIGGFTLAEDRSLGSALHVPAGSAWLVEVRGGRPDERGALLRTLHNAFPFRSDPALSAMGFGHTLVSRMPDRWS